MAIVSLWSLVGRNDVIVHHSPNQFANTRTLGGIALGMGMLPGFPDLIFVEPTGIASFIEVKAGRARLEPAQLRFQSYCAEHAIRHAVVRDPLDAPRVWREWGFLKRQVLQ